MEWTKFSLVIAGIALLCLGLFLGAQSFPREVVVEKEVLKTIEVVKEVPVVTEVVKEVPVEDTEKLDALQRELSLLTERYEQLADEPYDSSEVEKELSAIAKAKEDFMNDFKHKILRGHKSSEVSVEKWYDERVRIQDVTRTVDGKSIDYEKVIVWAELKARYEDSDGVDFKRWDIKVEYDIDSDGFEEAVVTATLV